MALTGTHHVAITVSDLEQSLKFYSGILGLRHLNTVIVSEKQVFRLFRLMGVKVLCAELRAGRSGRVELYHFESVRKVPEKYDFERIGLQHIAFTVRDLDETGRSLEAAGVEVLNDPAPSGNGTRVIFIRDPDGTLIQLVESPLAITPIGRALTIVNRILGRFGRDSRALVGTTISKETQK